jgi:hypothetical protein
MQVMRIEKNFFYRPEIEKQTNFRWFFSHHSSDIFQHYSIYLHTLNFLFYVILHCHFKYKRAKIQLQILTKWRAIHFTMDDDLEMMKIK